MPATGTGKRQAKKPGDEFADQLAGQDERQG
jgi:hypothetical protein